MEFSEIICKLFQGIFSSFKGTSKTINHRRVDTKARILFMSVLLAVSLSLVAADKVESKTDKQALKEAWDADNQAHEDYKQVREEVRKDTDAQAREDYKRTREDAREEYKCTKGKKREARDD
jgi:hypothetical protein